MGFSYYLVIDGETYENFGNVRIRQDADGFGISGCSTSEFTFEIPLDDYNARYITSNAPVNFYSRDLLGRSAPTCYISSRKRENGKVSFKCYDRMAFTDMIIEIDEMLFANDDESIQAEALVTVIAEQCGFGAWYEAAVAGSAADLPLIYLGKEQVIGKTCRSLLETVSSAWCGYFKTALTDWLCFVPFGAHYFGATAESHAAISEGSSKGPISAVSVSNGTENFVVGAGDVINTLKLTTDFASQELAETIFERVFGYTYQAWSCPKMLINDGSGNFEIDAEILFSDNVVRVANSIEKIPTPIGFICSCGRNEVAENEFEYIGALTRKINEKISDGEVLGSGKNKIMITRYQGMVVLAEKEKAPAARSAGENAGTGTGTSKKYDKYCSTVGEKGLVEYDGNLISKQTFDSCEVVDNDHYIFTYPGGVRYQYTVTENSGKIEINKERLEAEENGG